LRIENLDKMTRVRCIVIDDQEEAINVLKTHIANIDSLELLNTFKNPIEALQFTIINKVDLVFIDIQMPVMTGLEFIETLQTSKSELIPKFILTTGFDSFALESYKYGVIDYLMKPIEYKSIVLAVNKYLNIYSQQIENTKDDTFLDFFFADVNGKKTKIDNSSIIYVESAGNYLSIFTESKRFVTYLTFGELEKRMNQSNFVKIHKSFIVSIKSIVSVSKTEIEILYQNQTIILPFGRSFKESVKEKLGL
jgi:two-component system, LytTR family, response regulator